MILFTSFTSIQTMASTKEALSDKSVLFISSYSPSFDTFFDQIEGILSVFEETNVSLEVECMDSKRFYTQENLDNFYTSLKYKVEHSEPFDVVIVGDDNALNFVLEHDELFPEQPIVFLGINDVAKAKEVAKDPYISGVYGKTSIEGTVDLAKKLMPDARRVVGLVDNTVTGQAVANLYWETAKSEDDLTWDILDFSEMTFEEYEVELLKISQDDIVLLLSVHRDVTGESISFDEGVKKTIRNLEQPVFTIYDFGVGAGLVGGDVVSFQEQGRIAGEIAYQILLGKDPASFSTVENNTVKTID